MLLIPHNAEDNNFYHFNLQIVTSSLYTPFFRPRLELPWNMLDCKSYHLAGWEDKRYYNSKASIYFSGFLKWDTWVNQWSTILKVANYSAAFFDRSFLSLFNSDRIASKRITQIFQPCPHSFYYKLHDHPVHVYCPQNR